MKTIEKCFYEEYETGLSEISGSFMERNCEIYEIEKFIESSRRINKKIVLINANCHGTALVNFLSLSKEFSEMFSIFPIPAVQFNTEKKIAPLILNEADVFIHQDIRGNNSIAYELSDEVLVPQLNKSCLNLIIPNLVGFGRWLYPNLGEIILDKAQSHNLIFRDRILDEAVKASGNSLRDISFYISYFNGFEYSKEELNELFEQDMAKLQKREKKWDIKILHYILRHYKSIPMYVDAGHPSRYVMYEIGTKVLGFLGIKRDVSLEDYYSVLGMPTPVAPGVKQYFGIKYLMPLEPRKSCVFRSDKTIGEEQYVYEYIAEYLYHVQGLTLF